jgi:uncharacterized membrane protein YbjE (DUF340 family)
MMLSNKEFSKMTLEELLSEKQKMKSHKTTIAFLIGLLIGAAVWSATHKGGFITFLILIFAFLVGKKSDDTSKSLDAEISSREADRS